MHALPLLWFVTWAKYMESLTLTAAHRIGSDRSWTKHAADMLSKEWQQHTAGLCGGVTFTP